MSGKNKEIVAHPNPAGITLEAAIEICRKEPVRAGHILVDLVNRNTTAFPETVFIKRADGEGYMKQARVTRRLSEGEGHLVKMPGSKYDFALDGLRALNEIAGLQIIRPHTVTVDGKEQMNPYIEVDKETRMPRVVYSRCLAVGLSPLGGLVATDVMVRLDINIYLLEALQSKAKGLGKNDFQMLQIGTIDVRPSDESFNNRAAQWVFFPTHYVGGIGMWLNIKHEEAAKVLKEHTTRLKFIERLAQSFSERNAMKSHPAIPNNMNANNGVAFVPVIGWTSQVTRDDIDRMQLLVETDRLHDYKDSRGEIIDVEAISIDISKPDDEVAAVVEVEQTKVKAVESAESGEQGDEPAKKAQPDELLMRAMELTKDLNESAGSGAATKIKKSLDIVDLEEATEEELQKYIDKINKSLEG